MSRHRILVRIAPTGELTVEADGFQGKGCEAATAALEQALGKTVIRTPKREVWQQARVQQQQLGGET